MELLSILYTCMYLLLILGIIVHTKKKTLKVIATVLSGIYDIPAKNDVLGLVSHRGQFACSRCLHPGKVVKTTEGWDATYTLLLTFTITGGNVRVYPHSLITSDVT